MSKIKRSQPPRVSVQVVKSSGGGGLITKAMESRDVSDTKETEIAQQDGVLPQPYPAHELQKLVGMSTILQQCVEAYRRNIVGFGATPEYLQDDVAAGTETPEMLRDWNLLDEYIKFFSYDQSFEDVWGQAIEDREITGNAYLEILRDGLNNPVGGDRIDPKTMKVTKLTDFTEVEHWYNGRMVKRRRRFRRFVQEIGGTKVFFKEFGDPRVMNKTNGEFVNDALPEAQQATEVLHLKIGPDAYGVPRWIGQLIHIYGARKAEELNYRYFYQGRHTPMALMLSNAQLSDESIQQLTDYAKDIEGVDNAFKFLIIEAEGEPDNLIGDEKKTAKVELKSLADMLQKDAMFLEYDDSSRQKVQSSFRLPDIYVGRSKDFNRATADMARNITEEQVFEPERNSLEWVINNRLLLAFKLTQAKVVFKKPEISDWEAMEKMLRVINDIGGVAPNDVRELLGKMLGRSLEPFDGEQYDLPKGTSAPAPDPNQDPQPPDPIAKAANTDMTVLLKDIRDVLNEQYNLIGKVQP